MEVLVLPRSTRRLIARADTRTNSSYHHKYLTFAHRPDPQRVRTTSVAILGEPRTNQSQSFVGVGWYKLKQWTFANVISMSAEKKLLPPSRYLTTNNNDGKAVFITELSNSPPSRNVMGALSWNCYSTDQFPVKIVQDQDLQFYEESIQNPPGIVIPTGSAFRIVDLPPNYSTPMHRTNSVNFNVVIEGEVELILDSGETRILKRGDAAIQRVINHAFKNTSTSEWARMVAVPLPAEA